MTQNFSQYPTTLLLNSETKLFKLASNGSWNDQGTGNTSILRNIDPVQSLEITFKLNPKSPILHLDNSEGNENDGEETKVEEFLFESISSYSIQSSISFAKLDSILVFTCRQKRFALSFKDSDINFLNFFNDSIKSTETQLMEEFNARSVIECIARDDNFLQTLKNLFNKAEIQEDVSTIMNFVDVFKKLLADCNDTFIKATFTDNHIEFLLSVFQYGASNPKQATYKQYFKKIKYQNLLNVPAHVQKAAKLMIYLNQFKDIAPLMIEPKLQSYISYLAYENGSVIATYLIYNESVLISFFDNLKQNIRGGVKLISELIALLAVISIDNKNRLTNLLINPTKCDLFHKLTSCLNTKEIINCVKSDKQILPTEIKQSIFEEILKNLSTLSSSNPSEFEQFLLTQLKNTKSGNKSLYSAIVFGYVNGGINLKSIILELLSSIFNPETAFKHHVEFNDKGQPEQSKQIYFLLDRKVLTPICKQLFKPNTCFQGQELILEWISKIFFAFPVIMRRVIVESGIIKKALSYSRKQRILLLLILKILKSMLLFKDIYTIRYLKFSKVIQILNKAYINNKGKVNLINSLFKSLESDIEQLNYEQKSNMELQKIFYSEEQMKLL